MIEAINKRIKNLELLKNEVKSIDFASKIIKEALNGGFKVFFCGNGGSASDSNHLACEFIAKFKKERKSYPAISLSANNSIITAISNDYSFEDIFSRQLEGLASKGDVLVALSTSAKSKNVLKAIDKAKNLGLKTIFLTGGNKKTNADCTICAPSNETCEIQEMHIFIGHLLCGIIENEA